MYDLTVIGGGPGGYVAAIRGAQNGLKVLLIEKDSLGGTCLNRGCIPTKCFVNDSKLFKRSLNSPILTGSENLSINTSNILERKRKVVSTMRDGLIKLIKSNGIEFRQGLGKLVSSGKVEVLQSDGSSLEYDTRYIILATGSRPAVHNLAHVDGSFVKTTDNVLDALDNPKSITIIGGGVIGIEMAAIYSNIGSNVTILEALPDILYTEDKDIRSEMRNLLKKSKTNIFLNAKVKDITQRKGGVGVIFEDQDSNLVDHQTDQVLIATGREPVLEGIDSEKAGLLMDGPFIQVNSQLETNISGVYAIGDLVGGMMLAHKASAEGEIVVENIVGGEKKIIPNEIPRCIWGLTEIGTVGLSEDEARASGKRIKVGRFPFSASGAAQAMDHTEGFVKIIGDEDNGEILGAHIVGEHATDLISEIVTVMKMEGSVEDLYGAIKPHPTLSETVYEAAMDWNRLAVHTPKRALK